jgi:hypothetical protein
MMGLRRASLAGLAFFVAAMGLEAAQQETPKAPPTGARRDPGLFGTGSGKKKDKKEREEDENTRALAGYVRNEAEEPIEGAVVQLKDSKSLKVRSYITTADGIYRFFGLSTNTDYDIRADAKELSSEKRTLSIFDSRKEAVVNLKLTPRKKDDKEDKEARK